MTMTAAAPAPSALYTQLVLLDRQKHRTTRVREWTHRGAASGLNAVFCAAAEFAEACKAFPLLFIRSGDTDELGQPVITPVCLLGLVNGENLFVDDGRWTAPYEPAFLRRYPFALVAARQEDGTSTQAVAVDGAFEGLAEDGAGERLFGDNGEPTPYLEHVLGFLNDFESAVAVTRPIGAHLQSLGLLKDMRAEGTLANGEKFSVDGFFVVDEEKLRALPDDVVLQMHRGGLLALVHAHLVSLTNLSKLVDRKSARRR